MESEVPIRYLARALCSGLKVEPKTSALADLAVALGEDEMLPVTVAELSSAGLSPRVGLTSRARDWTIQVTSASVDVVYAPTRPPGQGPVFGEFCRKSSEYLPTALDLYELPAHRIALLQERLLAQTTDAVLDECAARLLNTPPPFTKHPFEWDWRVAVLVERSFGARSEPTNTIATVKRVQATSPLGEQSFRLLLATDVNTPPSNRRPRFASSDVASFAAESPTWHDALGQELLGFMGVS